MIITITIDEVTKRCDVKADQPLDRATLFRVLHQLSGGIFENVASQVRITPATDAGGIERPRLILPDFIEREAR